MSRATSEALARLTSARTSPVSKWTTLSASRLLYGSPQRRMGMLIIGVLLRPARSASDGDAPPDAGAPGLSVVVSIHPHRRRRREGAERLHPRDAVPGVLRRRRLPHPLVPLHEARHEELLRQGRQHHPALLAVADHLVVVVEVHHLDDG